MLLMQFDFIVSWNLCENFESCLCLSRSRKFSYFTDIITTLQFCPW